MTHKGYWLVLSVLLALAAVAAQIAFSPQSDRVQAWILMATSSAALGIAVFGPAAVSAGMFDLLDKWIDPMIIPRVNISVRWHVAYALATGAIFFFIWPRVVASLAGLDWLSVGDWLGYYLPDYHVSWSGSHWAWGGWSALTAVVGYLYERVEKHFTHQHK